MECSDCDGAVPLRSAEDVQRLIGSRSVRLVSLWKSVVAEKTRETECCFLSLLRFTITETEGIQRI